MRSAFAIVLIALTGGLARAQETIPPSRKLVVVLPLEATHATLEAPGRLALEEDVRTLAGDALSPLGYTVLTGDNTLRVLSENGVDPAKACESSCALEAARELGASYFVSGTLATDAGTHLAFIRLLEAATGTQLASVRVEGATGVELRRQFEEKASEFFSRVPNLRVRSDRRGKDTKEGPIRGGETDFDPGAEEVVVTFESDPPGAFVRVDGEIACQATPCARPIVPGVHDLVFERERFDAVARRDNLGKGAVVRVTLSPKFGWITVETEPAGVRVAIDGKEAGRGPIGKVEVDAGAHEVVVDDPCFARDGENVTVRKAEERPVRISATRRLGGLKVIAVDEKGDAIAADVSVDGVRLGEAPGPFKVGICARRLEVRDRAGRTFTTDLAVREKEVLVMTAALAPERIPSPAEAPQDGAPRPSFAIRAGFGGHVGALGVGVEYRPGIVGFALGTGTYALGGGLTFGGAANEGGPYLDLHAVWSRAGVFGLPQREGFGVGLTAGWDLRVLPWLSVKLGIGSALNTARPAANGKIPIVFDLSAGPVF